MGKLLNPIVMVLCLTAVHFFAGIVFMLFSMGGSFDDPIEPGQRVAASIWQALWYPVASGAFAERGLREMFPGLLGYVPIAANSFLWGIVLATPVYLLLYWWRGGEKPVEQA
jgi:hypothetical protein